MKAIRSGLTLECIVLQLDCTVLFPFSFPALKIVQSISRLHRPHPRASPSPQLPSIPFKLKVNGPLSMHMLKVYNPLNTHTAMASRERLKAIPFRLKVDSLLALSRAQVGSEAIKLDRHLYNIRMLTVSGKKLRLASPPYPGQLLKVRNKSFKLRSRPLLVPLLKMPKKGLKLGSHLLALLLRIRHKGLKLDNHLVVPLPKVRNKGLKLASHLLDVQRLKAGNKNSQVDPLLLLTVRRLNPMEKMMMEATGSYPVMCAVESRRKSIRRFWTAPVVCRTAHPGRLSRVRSWCPAYERSYMSMRITCDAG